MYEQKANEFMFEDRFLAVFIYEWTSYEVMISISAWTDDMFNMAEECGEISSLF